MSSNDFLDLIPPRPPSPPPAASPVQPYSIELPDELLRHIFELAVVANPHTARQLMLASKWVRAWVVRAFYETAFVKARAHLKQLAAQPDRLLAKMRSLWVGLRPSQTVHELLARTPGVINLAIMPNRGLPQLHDVIPSTMRLREFEVVQMPGRSFNMDMDLSSAAFGALTHLRLGRLQKSLLDQLASSDNPVLPCLTHLAVDSVTVASADCRRILDAPSRVDLQMLVVVIRSDGETEVSRLASPRLVALREYIGSSKARDWLARGRGDSGFWERAARQKQADPSSAGARRTAHISRARRVSVAW